MNCAIEIARVLNVYWLIETQLGPNGCKRLWISLRPGHRDRRIGGNNERDCERDDRSSDQDCGAEDYTPYQVSEHRSARDDPAHGKLAAELELSALTMASSAANVVGRIERGTSFGSERRDCRRHFGEQFLVVGTAERRRFESVIVRQECGQR
jgi:hypothetical protein